MPTGSRIARRLRARGDIVIGTRSSTLRRQGIGFRPRLTGFTDRTARFADGTGAEVDAVVWATGYRSDYSWLHVPGVLDDSGSSLPPEGGTTAGPGAQDRSGCRES